MQKYENHHMCTLQYIYCIDATGAINAEYTVVETSDEKFKLWIELKANSGGQLEDSC